MSYGSYKPGQDDRNNGWSYFSQNKKPGVSPTNDKEKSEFTYVKPLKGGKGPAVGAIISGFLAVIMLFDSLNNILAGNIQLSNFVYDLLTPLIVMGIFGVVAVRFLKKLKFNGIYSKYYSYISGLKAVEVESLAEKIGISENEMIKNLKQAVAYKMVPQGRLTLSNRIFTITNREYNLYMDNPEKYEADFIAKQAQKEKRDSDLNQVKDVLEEGKTYVFRIRESNALIDDEEVSEKLEKMEHLVSQIFTEVEKKPEQADKLGMFMSYYLPTTEKLLMTYAELEEKQFRGDNAGKTKLEIEQALDIINGSYEKLIDKLNREQTLDVEGDIAAMETMMKQEGLVH